MLDLVRWAMRNITEQMKPDTEYNRGFIAGVKFSIDCTSEENMRKAKEEMMKVK